ncbi:helix-turn-helix transcriptional regulator [Arthrobacter castelli]|uniref:helix-turn-helix transcriptional regulator n=1 Tax=Arthrobacter castelli TaxID=271431 RepID=UPI0003FF4356|nr:LuxR family transcriptional regulator [Arthrobacter castelli]
MDDFEAVLTSGRAAYERGDWEAACQQFSRARTQSRLSIEDLGRLSSSAFSCGQVQQMLDSSEELYHRLLRDGDTSTAAMKALSLALMWVLDGDPVVGSGWLNRARRLLQSEPESVEHGFLLYLDAAYALTLYDTGPAVTAAPELNRMGQRLQSPALTCLSLVLSGLVDVRDGRCAEGFAQLDEAMLPVLAGQVAAEWAGDIYCTVIHVCHQLADLRRMRAWTTATERWCEQFTNGVTYSGICRVHRLQLLSFEGGWEVLEEELVRSSADLEDRNPWVAGEAYYQLGDIRRLRGNAPGAWDAFGRARELGVEPQPGEALLYLDTGRPDAGWSALCAALDVPDRLARARLLRPAVHLAQLQGLPDEAERLCRELEETAAAFASSGFRAWAEHARAGLLTAQARPGEALPLLRSAARLYHDLRGRYEVAGIYELMGQAHRDLGQLELAAANSAAALQIYRSLGAGRDIERLSPTTSPAGLTPREVEVLARVAEGASNKDIAAALFISQKTVGRHLANIFIKLGVTSRTAAAAWAHDRKLAASPPAN